MDARTPIERAAAAPVPSEPVKAAPHSIETEKALLGALLVNNQVFERVQEILRPLDFYEPIHASIFEVAADLIVRGKSASPITLKPSFEDFPPIAPDMTVVQYLGHLAANATTLNNAREYAETIVELARRRLLILIGEDLVSEAFDASHDGKFSVALIEEVEQRLFDAVEKQDAESRVVPFSELVARNVAFAERAYEHKGKIGNISTGLIDLDNALNGLRNTDLIIIAGRPSMGKTALATNIAYNVAKGGVDDQTGEITAGTPVGFFSLEMSNEQLSLRVLASAAEVSAHKIARGMTSEAEIRKLQTTGKEIERTPFHIDDRGGISIGQLASRARRMKRRNKIGLLVVDYLQLLHSKANGKAENRVQELTEVTIGLKALAKELGIPIIALSQLSRGVDGRENKRPLLSDLRESGSIEQDADVVIMVYREHYYLKRSMPDIADEGYAEHEAKCAAAEGKAEAIIAKDRHGPGGIIELQFTDELVRFSSLSRSQAAVSVGGRS